MEYLIFVGSILLIWLMWRFYFSQSATIQRRMKRAPSLPIDQFKENSQGKVVGQIADLEEPLTAPLSGRPCAYYKVVVEVWIGDKYDTWRVWVTEEQGRDFVLRDVTGRIFVPMSEARVLAEEDAFYRSGKFNDAAPSLEAFLQRHGRKSTNFLGMNKPLRYKESILAEGEPIAVAGVGQMREGELLIGGGAKVPLYVSDVKSVLASG